MLLWKALQRALTPTWEVTVSVGGACIEDIPSKLLDCHMMVWVVDKILRVED